MTDGSAKGPAARRSRFAILLTASLVSSLIGLDSNIVAVSLPAIARSLGATFADIEWVVSAYVLTFAALLLAAGSFADRRGRKWTMLVGLVLFTAASCCCGLAPSALALNVARAFQGVGASLLLTAALAVINHAFTGTERAKAYAFWGACIGIAITCGPILGGVITDLFGWRWVFLVNLPVGVALLAASAAFVDESRDEDARSLDGWGIVTFSSSLLLLIWALIDGNRLGWTAAPILWRLAAATVFALAFTFVELRQRRPMVDFALFAEPTFLGSSFAMLGYAASAQVMMFYLPLFLQTAFGFAPTWAGLAMIPFALPMLLMPRVAVRLASRFSGRALLAMGLTMTLLGNVLLSALARGGAPYPQFTLGMLVVGFGAGLLNSETAKVMQGAVPAQRAGVASGLSATIRFTGLLLGVAALGAVLAHVASSEFLSAGAAIGLDPGIAARAASRIMAGDFAGMLTAVPPQLQTAARAAGLTAFSGGFAAASEVAAAVAAVTGILAFALVRASDTRPIELGKSAIRASR